MKEKTIIFLGDSITECFDLGKFFPNYKLINKGKSGDTTIDILNRLEKSVFMLNPFMLFLLIGTNDLELLNSTPEEVISNINLILKRIKDYNKDIIINLISIFPVNQPIKPFSVGKRKNKDINTINKSIKMIKDVTYLDINKLLKDEKGLLNKEYTYDGIHINEKGYLVISDYLKGYLE